MSDRNDPGSGVAGAHPFEVLAGYVDGTATREERDLLQTHLATCSACAEEVALARSSVAAAAGIEEAPAPGLDPAAIVSTATTVVPLESRRAAAAGPRNRSATWLGVVGGLAAAAIVGVFAFGLVRATSGGGTASTAAGPEPAAPGTQATGGTLQPPPSGGIVPTPTSGPLVVHKDFTKGSVAGLARSLASGSEILFQSRPHGAEQPAAAAVATAVSCAQRAASTSREPVLVIRATFEGRPAFVTAFKPTHTAYARVVVTPVGGCAILYQALYQGSAASPSA